jgi:hypothetical protein
MGAIEALASQFGSQVAGQTTSGLGDLIWGDRTRKKQLKQQEQLNSLAEQSNIRMMDEKLQRDQAMYDYTYKSQKDVVNELKEAGLNPALAYGSGGAMGGGGTTTGGAPSIGAGHASDEAAIRQARAAEMQQGLSMGLMRAEKRLKEAQAGNLEADAENKRGIEREEAGARISNLTKSKEQMDAAIGKLNEETKNEKVKRVGLRLQNTFDEIRNEIQEKTEWAEINRINWLMDGVRYEVDMIKNEKEIKDATKDNIIEASKLSVIAITKDILLKNKSIKMTETQIDKMLNDIINEKRALSQKDLELYLKDKYPNIGQVGGRVLNWVAEMGKAAQDYIGENERMK